LAEKNVNCNLIAYALSVGTLLPESMTFDDLKLMANIVTPFTA